MTLEDAKALIDARLDEKPFANLDDILGEGWSVGLTFRGHGPTYRARALEKAKVIVDMGLYSHLSD